MCRTRKLVSATSSECISNHDFWCLAMTELEFAAIAFFRALRATGKECLEHDRFGFKLDVNVMAPPDDKEAAMRFGAKVQEALTHASQVVQPVTIEGTSLQ